MRLDNLTRYTNGWILGNFSPALFNNEEVEVAIKRYPQGSKEHRHFHAVAREFTIIVSGKVRMNGVEFFQDDVVVIEPGESTDFEAITDAVTTVIK